MDDKTNLTIYQTLKNFINDSTSLEDEEKEKYLEIIENLSQGKTIDLETAGNLAKFLEQEFRNLENAAILSKNAAEISLLADLRNAQLELQKQLLQLHS